MPGAGRGFVSPVCAAVLDLRAMPAPQFELRNHVTWTQGRLESEVIYLSLGWRFLLSFSVSLSCILQELHPEKRCDVMLEHGPWIRALGSPVT